MLLRTAVEGEVIRRVQFTSKAGSQHHCEQEFCPCHPGPYSVLFGPCLHPLPQSEDESEGERAALDKKCEA